jgi:hypothetical protein
MTDECCTPGSYSYRERHRLVDRQRGPARGMPCEICGGPATGWATIPEPAGLPHRHDVHLGYRRLCAICHGRFDAYFRGNTPNAEARGRRTRDDRIVTAMAAATEGMDPNSHVATTWLTEQIMKAGIGYEHHALHSVACLIRSALPAPSVQVERKRGYYVRDIRRAVG